MSKKALFATSSLKALADITDKEEAFFTQLIIQSAKITSGSSKNTAHSASKLLKHNAFIINSCKALKGFHTHNPKIYDAKVKGRVFATKSPFVADSPYIYSDSVSYHHLYGWAGNATNISKRYFLCTEFLYKNHHTTLYHEFLKTTSELVDILVFMGLPRASVDIIRSACLKHSQSPFPDSVPPYQVQVLVPWGNGDKHYIAVSPIASSAVQAAVHNFCWTEDAYPIGRAFHNLSRPENIGALATAARGSIAILSPELKLQKRSLLSTAQLIESLKEKNDLFTTSGLDFSFFLAVRKKADYSTNRYSPAPLSAEKAKVFNRINKNTASLFSKLDALRAAFQSGRVDKSAINKLKPTQGSYVTEIKLSTKEAHSLWQEANSVTQGYISNSNYKQLAYHPLLTRYISDSIRNHIKPLYRGNIEAAKPELNIMESTAESHQHDNYEQPVKAYLFIPQLTVFNAHADNSPYTTGLPAITALVGFVDRLCRNIRSRFNIDMAQVKVAWLVHRFQRLRGIKRHEPARWNYKTKTAMADVVSRKFCNLTFDLLIQCDADTNGLESVSDALPECLPTHFAAGIINTPEELPSDQWQSESFQIYNSIEALLTSTRVNATDNWLVTDYSSQFNRQSDSILCDLSNLYADYKPQNPADSCLSLSGVGYKLLEPPCQRTGSRLPLHSYAEPVVGIQLLKPLRSTSMEDILSLPIFWSYHKADDLILCKASAVTV